jgi:DNA repair exonuclease SbcCD ATPase subunit
MIRHVRLRQWRSYDTLELDFGPGTTFVVAPNGVGKTSLVLGLAWALFGEHADVDPRACIRAGADIAEVEATVVLPDGRELTITRQIGRRGRPTVKGRLDGTGIDGPAAVEVLERAFEVDLDVAANLSMMLGGGQLASEQPLELKSHLYTAFGVTGLLRAAETAEKLTKDAEKQRAAVRARDQERLADRAAVVAQIATLDGQLRELQLQREHLQAAVREADQERKRAEQVATYHDQLRRYEATAAELVARATPLVSVDLDAGDVEQAVRSSRERAERDADFAGDAYAAARGTIAAASEAIEALTGADAYCPTCLRPIGAGEVTAATAEHEHRLHAAAEAGERHAREQAAQRARSAALAELLTRLDSLHRPTPPDVTVDLVVAEAQHAAALEALEAHNQTIGGLQSQLQQLTAQLAADDRIAENERALHRAYRREAISAAAAIAFRRAVTEVTESLIEPVATEVTWRWKRLFASGGLTLRSDGTIVREEQGEGLPWSTLSDGERIWARIVTHLLVIASSTRLPFVWFDEPLEHLDPQLRHAVAATLATATEGGNPRQLLVTTYEHALARQLADDTPDAALINVRLGQHQGPRGEPGSGDTATAKPARRATGPARRAS